MPVYKNKYQVQFKNFEEQSVRLLISDTYSGLANPYDFYFTVTDIGGGNIRVDVYFTGLPAAATQVNIGYSSNQLEYVFTPGGLSSPQSITIAAGAYWYQAQVIIPSGNELYNLDSLDGSTEELEAAPPALRLICNNAVANKFNVVAGLQAKFRIKQKAEYILNKLLRGTYGDQRYLVDAYINDLIIFKGFLAISETEEPFLPYPVVEFTAIDGLRALESKQLKNFYNENPEGHFTIAQYLAWCLALTGLQLNINVVFNIRDREAGTIAAAPDEHFFNTQFLDAFIAENDIDDTIYAYDLLQKIFKHSCFIGQRHGQWWLKNVDEFDDQPDYVAVFDYQGNFIEMKAGAYYNKVIGPDDNIKFADEAQAVTIASPAKLAKDTYRYTVPKEIPYNVDFSRGALTETVSATEKKYYPQGWELLFSDVSSDESATSDIHIKRIFENDYEKERYLVLPASSDFNFIMSKEMPANAGDKFILSVQRRLSSDVAGTGFYRDNHIQLRLYGNDGTYWTLKAPNSADTERKWYECDSTFRTNQKFISIEGDAGDDLTEAASAYDGESAELPVAGKVRVLLYQSSLYGATKDTYFNINLDYIAKINGSHSKYNSQYHKVSAEADNNIKVDEEVSVSDSPAPMFKGALKRVSGYLDIFTGAVEFSAAKTIAIPKRCLTDLYPGQKLFISSTTNNNNTFTVRSFQWLIVGSVTSITVEENTVAESAGAAVIRHYAFELSPGFWDAAKNTPPVFPYNDAKPYGYLQVFNVWNQVRLINRILRGRTYGIESSSTDALGRSDLPTIFHKWVINEVDEHSTGKYFMCAEYDMDIERCRFNQIVLREVKDATAGKTFDDDYEFKYQRS